MAAGPYQGIPAGTAALHATETSQHSAEPGFTIASGAGIPCPNPIDGVCLLPEIEFAYDIAYQDLPGDGFTPMQRALAEINELEMFFERGFNYRFSRLSITMLNAEQDALIGNTSDADTLLDRLRVLRGSGQLDFLQNSRSIFHFVTGRDFPSTVTQGNVVGLAYLSQVCAGSGLNTSLTDAGDTPAVSLVMAHEIAHNLGAVHDDPATNGCDASAWVMSGSIGAASSSITDFSACSIADISAEVGARASPSCFDYPVDISVEPALSNPDEPPIATPFESRFVITRNDGWVAVDKLRIDAMLDPPVRGQFVAASVPGGTCSVFVDAVSCIANLPPAELELSLTTVVEEGAERFSITASAQSETNGTVDLLGGNEVATVEYSRFGPALPTAPAVQPPADATAQGGGGGGSAGWGGLLLMFGALLVRLQLRRRFGKPAQE